MTWWGQCAKVQWIEEGDGNTHFFHNMASARRRTNLIEQLKHTDGRTVTDQSEILRMMEEFFQQKWENNDIIDYGWPSFDSHFACLQRLGMSLDSEITREEIWHAVKSMGKNRAPGRDGVTASFFKSFWDIVGEQVNLACLEFFSLGRMEPEWKDIVVVLLPKDNNADYPSKFRPISLCQTIYKVIAKILVNHIKGILPSIISEEQAAFIPGRSISDHCLLGQEIINMFKVSKSAKGWLALKVNMEQAYDKMNWRTLEIVLTKMGFPQIFRSWVMSCVTALRFAILVNGTLTDGITVGCGATIPNVRKLLTTLDDYCGWTGQRINKNKSAILFSRMVTTSTRSRLARLAGCRMVTEMDYHGIKFVMRRRLTKADFSPLLQKIQSHILAWGTRQLSLGVLAEAERLCRSFLWDKDQNHKSLHYASWGSLTRSRRQGGLGFHARSSWTGPLSVRIAWDFVNKPHNLFQRCMRHKYGAWPWMMEHKRGESNGWRIICSGAKSLDYAICSWPTFCNIELAVGSRVDEFIMTGGGWDRNKLRHYFGETLVELICEVIIWSELHTDTLELTKSTLGTSLSTICYNAEYTGEEDQVCTILHMHMRPRERVFWWRLDLIPTLTWLNCRGLGAGLSCLIGCNQHENLDHVTTQCLQLLKILKRLDDWGFVTPRFACFMDLKEALQRGLATKAYWTKIYCSAVFYSWGNRNAIHHGKTVNSITGLAAMVLGSTSHGVFSNSLEQRFTHQSVGLFQNASWCPPLQAG
ncbi:uncharacterized protein LOC110098987 [Dendrobium catenatum]|uniref:uncharacterized protein LOC110098987 n=1 Tax=Dendrobium catenatum TaxID=906689 RepID=UPI00109F3F16|nr:uncharacterized protein LOC110098987 [Dendrobium catenatum]